MNTRLQTSLILALAVLAGCDEDPTAPPPGYCDTTGNCGIEGVDVAIVEVDLVFDDDQPFRSEVDAHVVEPGDEVDLFVRVVNRGTLTSAPGVLRVANGYFDANGASVLTTQDVPSLDPGEERLVAIEVPTPELEAWWEQTFALGVSLATDSSGWYDDADSGNNASYPVAPHLDYHPLVPILSFDWSTAPDTVRALELSLASGQVTNESHFVSAPAFDFGLCIVDEGTNCDDGPHGPVVRTTTLTPGQTASFAVGFLAPAAGIDVHDPADEVGFTACQFVEGSAESWGTRTCMYPWTQLAVRPNLEAACDPGVVAPADTFEVTAANACDPQGMGDMIHVAALDAAAGMSYNLTLLEGNVFSINVYDDEGHRVLGANLTTGPAEFTTPESRRYYIVSGVGSRSPPPALVAIE